jgi:pimeloyl-ACP methyl ester carboxylesterase
MHVNGVDLHVEVRGDGPVILGIHGTPSSAVLWQDAADELARHGTCVVYDRRGFHRSGPSGHVRTLDLQEHVDDAAALLDVLSAAPAVVIGRSTGGLVALELARRHPGSVRALVLLEPAVFTVDPQAAAWASALRQRILEATADDPSRASEAVMRVALGDETWESFSGELRDLFVATGPAVLAELAGHGLDLSEDPLELSDDELAGIRQPVLILTAEDSPQACRQVDARLTEALPDAVETLVPGGHLISPAHPAILDFVDRILRRPGT